MKFVGKIDENHSISTKEVINTIKQVHAEFQENSVSSFSFYELQKTVKDLEMNFSELQGKDKNLDKMDEYIQEQLEKLVVLPRKVNQV